MDYWVEEMKNGKVLRLYPFLVVMDSILRKERSLLRCGSGHDNFTIVTNGKISPCPIMTLMKKYYCGDLENGYKKMFVNWRCVTCFDYDLCGGRCLYSNILYSDLDSFKELCKTTHLYLEALKERSSVVRELIANRIISLDDFKHLKYNGVEVIP
jgi:radical SAM protein with 4Fe4S-binding SPASM domain